MRLRLRLVRLTPAHATFAIFEGREHGPRLGEVTVDRANAEGFVSDLANGSVGPEDDTCLAGCFGVGDTLEADLVANTVVRVGGMAVGR
jgi:hypothetical protein